MLLVAPLFWRSFPDPIAPPTVTASAVYVLNADTGQAYYHKGGEGEEARLKSITKLVTAHVLVTEVGDLSATVTTVSGDLAPGSTANLQEGDIWTLEDLLWGALLPSGNDAATAIARHVGGLLPGRGDVIDKFVAAMNAAALKMGATDTTLVDPSGLSHSNVGSARDAAKIGAAVFLDKTLGLYGLRKRRRVAVSGPNARTEHLKTTVRMLGADNVFWGKTGTQTRGTSTRNLVIGWRAPNRQRVVAAILGSTSNANRYGDMRAILAQLPLDFPKLMNGPAWPRTRAALAARLDRIRRRRPIE